MRKPKRIDRGTINNNIQVYADFDDSDDCIVYIGGASYQDFAQIHLNECDVHALARYLTKASDYLKSKKSPTTRKKKNGRKRRYE